MVQGGGAGGRSRDREGYAQDDKTIDRGNQGGRRADESRFFGRTLDDDVRDVVPVERRADVGAHGFRNRGMTALFGICIHQLRHGLLPLYDAQKGTRKGGEGE